MCEPPRGEVMVILGSYRGYIGVMEKKMETIGNIWEPGI